MPSYEDLREYFDQQEQLQAVASRVSRIPIVKGITVDVDPLWAHTYDIGTGLIHRGAYAWLELSEGYIFPWLMNYPGVGPLLQPPTLLWMEHQGYRRRDLSYSDSRWKNFQKLTKERFDVTRLPVLMTVVHRPVRPPLRGTSTGEEVEDQSQLRNLINIINEYSVLVRIEERPTARLSFNAGDEIDVGGKTGTLGGALYDSSTGILYGVTCAHVATRYDTIKDSAGNVLGVCIADTGRIALLGTTISDPIALPPPHPYPGNGPIVNMLDCSLIKLTSPISKPMLGGTAGVLSPGQKIVLKGAQSNMKCNLGSLAISYIFTENQQDYCFRDSIELIPQPSIALGGTPGRLFAHPPKQGDSGAWVLTDDTTPIWAGMFFGEDGTRGFAIRASWVQDWAESIVGNALSV